MSSCRSLTLASMRHEAWAGAGSPSPCVDAARCPGAPWRASAGVDLSSASDRPSHSAPLSALMDSRPFVVFSDRPSTPYTPRRCNVRVSSRPSARLPAADGSDPPAHAGATGGRRGPRRTFGAHAAATPAAHAWPGHSPRSRGAIDTVAPGRGGGRRAARPPSPAAIYVTSSPWETSRPRTKDRRNGVNTSRQSPGTVCPPSS